MIGMVLNQAIATKNGKVGSIGANWPPKFDASNSRIKGFCTRLIDDERSLNEVFSEVTGVKKSNPEATRATFRAFVSGAFVESLRFAKRNLDYNVEADIPAQNALPGHHLVYFGRNEESRTPPESIRSKERGDLAIINTTVNVVPMEQAIARAEKGGYQIELKQGGIHRQDIDDMLNLYHEAYQKYTFEVNENTIQYMVGNGNKVVFGRGSDGRVASTLIAEECTLHLENGKTVTLYELSDFATFRQDRGNGLITAMQHFAVDLIRNLPGGEEAIIYAEDRAPWNAVNRSSKQAGLMYSGTLPYACDMLADRSIEYAGQYESLNVWHAWKPR